MTREETALNNAVYLTMPAHLFKGDITYRVVSKEKFFYFCWCGNKNKEINLEIAASENLTEGELLEHKKSFKIRKDKIKNVEIVASKTRCWIAVIPESESADLNPQEKLGFIVHKINDRHRVYGFFKAALYCPVTMKN